MISEEKIIKGCIKGKASAQEQLYNLYAERMLGVCLRYSSSKQEAEDIMQDAFVKVFTKIETFKKQKTGSLGGWIHRIMVNTALNHYRDNARHMYHKDIDEMDETTHFPEEEENSELPIDPKMIMAIIQELPPGYKMVFNLYVFENKSHNEIAEELNISVNTSKSQLSKARAYIRKQVNIKIKEQTLSKAI